MIACVIHGANDLKIENRSAPSHPQDDEVLVRFGAGGICGSDLHYYHEGGILDFERIDIGPILSGEFPLANAINAFELASDRSNAMRLVPGTGVFVLHSRVLKSRFIQVV